LQKIDHKPWGWLQYIPDFTAFAAVYEHAGSTRRKAFVVKDFLKEVFVHAEPFED
jgi:hypothetical protein